jgi:hypothetical protein
MIADPGTEHCRRRLRLSTWKARMLMAACAMVLTAAMVSAFASGVPQAVARSTPAQATAAENTVTWAPAGGAQVIDTGSDCAVTMSGTVHAPDLTTAQTLQTTLSDLRGKVTDVSKGGYDNLRLSYVSQPSLDGDYRITLQGVTVIDCSLARSSQALTILKSAAAPAQDSPVTGAPVTDAPITAAGGSGWKKGVLGAFAGIATYLAVTAVVAAALAVAGVEFGTTLAVAVASAATGCMAGLVGSTVALAVSGNQDKIGLASAAGGCIVGSGIAWEAPVEAMGDAVGNAIRTLSTAAPGIIEAVGGQELVAAGEGIEMTSLGTAVDQAAEGALAVS